MNFPPSFVHEFIRRLDSSSAGSLPPPNRDIPSYDFHDASEQNLVVTNSQPQSFQLGTGASLLTDSLLPAITSARHEVILVTCFWAQSKTLTALCDALTKLAAHRRLLIEGAISQGSTTIPPLRVHICFSSRSLFQKLLHTQSHNGYVYPPSSWQKKLGLPESALLEAGGIHLQVKSLFFLPFSVMHPKFVIVDRQRALVPSCNVSWEPWLEGCVELTGDAVQALFAFYSRTWGGPQDFQSLSGDTGEVGFDSRAANLTLIPSTAHHRAEFQSQEPIPTLVLPSSHHRNPRFRPFPWQGSPMPPNTPLNTALLQLLEQAQRSIYIQTPNITCEAVIAALLGALARGIDVTIVTNRNMMVLEQLVTAGTTTAWSIRSFIRRFRQLKAAAVDGVPARHGGGGTDLEAGRRVGHLRISYFKAKPQAATGLAPSEAEEPVHSHLKLTVVDSEYTVLGSGNLDRASLFTSQELGLMFYGREFGAGVKAGVDRVLDGRLDLVYDSGDVSDG
ncbi:uncharacterized protein B0H64DRAFT_407908 [Chaetomium fimeti]|uniref:PLD phosphodiesterase domain-containing protein n=1 Tax=Chaetomium fimeti TaxID=1854472 RepID=A0AAE0H845_9PEZI|nr:hypothetical protein B0H64DRAFT_407908 [Chaetomium fimeti]